MLSLDASHLLYYYYSVAAPRHEAAHAFFSTLSDREDVALSEFVLTEICPSSATPPSSPNS